ncbi:D-tyrosyl-tRNA(Tyr) deacylase 1 [Trichinella pseudospiralis]|uniref:D-aminoacyl-tRNA deacylase n=1 Tax=Trichinella pseudospiralis TaxID=6337 RepID=A0A0V1FSI9_TRIPS|nr:D-tyrosyl-tRNA(Tyr) deacylase 1 [Trichinella pseudospiralis]
MNFVIRQRLIAQRIHGSDEYFGCSEILISGSPLKDISSKSYAEKRWNKSLEDLLLKIFCLSQCLLLVFFTVNAVLKRNKLNFHLSVDASEAAQFYYNSHVALSVENDGPVTIILDSKQKWKKHFMLLFSCYEIFIFKIGNKF